MRGPIIARSKRKTSPLKRWTGIGAVASGMEGREFEDERRSAPRDSGPSSMPLKCGIKTRTRSKMRELAPRNRKAVRCTERTKPRQNL